MVLAVPGAKVLITGVAGFIGSFLAERLLREGYYVVGVDNLFRGKKENIEGILKKRQFEFHLLDITKPLPDRILQDVDIVMHYAAINGTKYFYEIPQKVLQVNVKGTINVLEAAVKNEVDFFVFASSSEVYGEPQYFPTDEKHPLIIPDIQNPRYSYAASKVIGEAYVIWYGKAYGIDFLILRIFNTYGPRMDTSEYGQVIPEFIRKVLLNEEFTIIGPGTQTRSFCYIEDHVEYTIRLLNRARNEIVNVGTNEEISILELAKIIHEIVGREFKYKLLPSRPGDPMRRVPDVKKLLKLTNYRPQYDIKKGLLKTIEWYKKRLLIYH